MGDRVTEMEYIISPFESEAYIEHLETCQIEDFGSKKAGFMEIVDCVPRAGRRQFPARELLLARGAHTIFRHTCEDNPVLHLKKSIYESSLFLVILIFCNKNGWFEFHKKLILVNQQSVMEINSLREESVKELFVSLGKIPIIIYEAIQISVWKQKIFPLLMNMNQEPKNTFMLFSIFYHEDIAVSLLENVLFHSDSAESMNDEVLDLIDYAVERVINIIGDSDSKIIDHQSDFNASCIEEILEKKRELEFDIGMRSISILRYLAEYLDRLPIPVLSRMLTTHDIPYLLIQLLELRPWIKQNEKEELLIYGGGNWTKMNPNEMGKISKIEAQVWFGLRELLLNPKCVSHYEITENRLAQLLKLQKYLHETTLDQISPLLDLKRWLSYLNISSVPSAPRGINVEVLPQIKSSILERYNKKWQKLAKNQCKVLFTQDPDYIKEVAHILHEAYDLDKLDCVNEKKCFLCQDTAKKRCSKCKEAWYCGRECQVKHWANHKDICNKIVEHEEHMKKTYFSN